MRILLYLIFGLILLIGSIWAYSTCRAQAFQMLGVFNVVYLLLGFQNFRVDILEGLILHLIADQVNWDKFKGQEEWVRRHQGQLEKRPDQIRSALLLLHHRWLMRIITGLAVISTLQASFGAKFVYGECHTRPASLVRCEPGVVEGTMLCINLHDLEKPYFQPPD